MRKFIEVIVTSGEEASEAEAGGADRLEVVRELAVGGFTPAMSTVREVLNVVRVPVRVMLRENTTMSVKDEDELEALCAIAREVSSMGVDGMVTGFIAKGEVDREALHRITRAAPGCAITFHRAFEEVGDCLAAIADLKRFPRVDRILARGGTGEWQERRRRLLEWQRAASPEIAILTGIGLGERALIDWKNEPLLREGHVGRMAREPQAVEGAIRRERIAYIKNTLA